MNNQNFNISQDKLNDMLSIAAKKLGTSPDKLKNQLQSGNLDALKSNKNLMSILNDSSRVNEILNNPQVQSILKNSNPKK